MFKKVIIFQIICFTLFLLMYSLSNADTQSVFAIMINEKIGFVDEMGTIIVNPIFEDVGELAEDLIPVCNAKYKWGFINTSGNQVIEPIYDDVTSFYEGYAAVKIGTKWGFIKKDGTFLIVPKYDDIKRFRENLAAVQIKGKWGFIDQNDTIIINPKYDNVCRFTYGIAAVKIKNKWGFINNKGKLIINPTYEDSYYFYSKEYPLKSDLILCPVKYKGKWGLINDKNQFIVKPIYKEVLVCFDDLIAVCNDDDLWGYVDKNGILIIKHQFTKAHEFTIDTDGIASIQVGGDTGKWGYITKTGEFLINPQFDNAWDFKKGIAKVQIGENFYLIDKNGNYIFNPENHR